MKIKEIHKRNKRDSVRIETFSELKDGFDADFYKNREKIKKKKESREKWINREVINIV